MLVASDQITGKDWDPASRVKGDIFMLVGASLYGFSESPMYMDNYIITHRSAIS